MTSSGGRGRASSQRRRVGVALVAACIEGARAHQAEAIAFYTALDYTPAGTESNPNGTWTLLYLTKEL